MLLEDTLPMVVLCDGHSLGGVHSCFCVMLGALSRIRTQSIEYILQHDCKEFYSQ